MDSEESEVAEKRENEPISAINRRRRRMRRRVLSHHVPRPSYNNGVESPQAIGQRNKHKTVRDGHGVRYRFD